MRFLAGEPLDASFDGHTNCFIETGFHKALLIDFNYDTEPLPGHFPGRAGPMPLLKESRLNHLGKLMFQPLYWHALLPGRGLPGHHPGDEHGRQEAPERRGDIVSTQTIAGTEVEVNDEGFFVHPEQWSDAIGVEIAKDRGHRSDDRPPLAGRALHAPAVPRHRHRAVDPRAGQGVGRAGQGALPALPEGPGEARRQDRRHPEAARVHLRSANTNTDDWSEPWALNPSRRCRSSCRRARSTASIPALIMANGARMEGIEANVFFTFFGLDAINKERNEHVKVASVGNPGLHLATWVGGVPGMSAMVTHKLGKRMEELDFPSIPEFMELLHDSGAGLYACKASVDMFELTRDDFIDEIDAIITVGEFYEQAAGGQIIFT